MILATDLDGTFLGGTQQHRENLYNIIRANPKIRLIFVTGRCFESVAPLLNDPFIPKPEYIICDVGATVLHGTTLEPVQPIQNGILEKWPGEEAVLEAMKDVSGLRLQPINFKNRCSYLFDAGFPQSHVEQLAESLNCDVIMSDNRFLDIMPRTVNKGTTLTSLLHLLDISPDEVLVAGDTLNDLSLYGRGFKGVVVGEAEPALCVATAGFQCVYQSEVAGAGGILAALQHYERFSAYHQQ